MPIRPTSGLATASMVMGLIGVLGGWCFFGLPCAVAVLLGHMALRETKTGERGGHGQAVAGLILGYLCLVPCVLITVSLVVPALLGSGAS